MHLVGFIIKIYHDARSSECQISAASYYFPIGAHVLSSSLFKCAICVTSARCESDTCKHQQVASSALVLYVS